MCRAVIRSNLTSLPQPLRRRFFLQVAAAFSAVSFANGYASGMGFLTFPYLTRLQMAGLCVWGTLLSLIAYLFGFRLQRLRLEITALNAERDARLDDIRKQGRSSRMVHNHHHHHHQQQQQQQQQQQHQQHQQQQSGKVSARAETFRESSDEARMPRYSNAQILATSVTAATALMVSTAGDIPQPAGEGA